MGIGLTFPEFQLTKFCHRRTQKELRQIACLICSQTTSWRTSLAMATRHDGSALPPCNKDLKTSSRVPAKAGEGCAFNSWLGASLRHPISYCGNQMGGPGWHLGPIHLGPSFVLTALTWPFMRVTSLKNTIFCMSWQSCVKMCNGRYTTSYVNTLAKTARVKALSSIN